MRVYSGIHFVDGCYAGIKSANKVADWVYAHELRPLNAEKFRPCPHVPAAGRRHGDRAGPSCFPGG
jgi:hypothetical protein